MKSSLKMPPIQPPLLAPAVKESWGGLQRACVKWRRISSEGCFWQGSHKATHPIFQSGNKQHPQTLNTHWEPLPARCTVYQPRLHYIKQITTKRSIQTGLKWHNFYINICLVVMSVETSSSSGRMEKKAAGIKPAKPLVITPGRAKRLFGDEILAVKKSLEMQAKNLPPTACFMKVFRKYNVQMLLQTRHGAETHLFLLWIKSVRLLEVSVTWNNLCESTMTHLNFILSKARL